MKIIEFFKNVTDKRKAQGKQYKAESVLALVLISRLCGSQGIKAAHRLGSRMSIKQLNKLGFKKKIPTYQGMLNIMDSVDIDSFEEILFKIIMEISSVSKKAARLLAIDGKRLRGSGSKDKNALHLVSAFCYHLNAVFRQVESGYGGGEIAAALEILDKLPLEGMIITGDATFTHFDICKKIISKNGDYVLTVKTNQKNLEHETELALRNAKKSGDTREHVEKLNKNHGRIEQRSIVVADMPWEYNNGWSTIKQVACITRYRDDLSDKSDTKKRTTVTHVITSLPKELASPAQILACNRGHWSIENRLHRTRDTTFDEDRNRLRTGTKAHINAAISNLVIFLCRHLKRSVTEATEAFANNLNVPTQLVVDFF